LIECERVEIGAEALLSADNCAISMVSFVSILDAFIFICPFFCSSYAWVCGIRDGRASLCFLRVVIRATNLNDEREREEGY
jgi:hypothetical protein